MSVPLTIQGVTFQYPQQYDNNWGPTLTNWSTAVTNAIKPLLTGGSIQVGPYPGATLNFANATNSGYLPLAINGSNQLTFNGTPLATSGGGTVNAGTQYQLAYYSANGTAVSGLTLITPNKALESDANGLPIASGVSSTTLAFLDATSSVQTQLNSKLNLTGGTLSGILSMGGNKITALADGVLVADAVTYGQFSSVVMMYLPLAGGTLSGNLNMGGQQIINMTQATAIGDAVSFPVNAAQIASATITATQIANSTITGAKIASNVALAGSPTTTTQAINDASTKIATTAFANPGSGLSSNGYNYLPSGLLLQWGAIPLTTGSGTAVTITFPIAFPTATWNVQAIAGNAAGTGLTGWHIESSATTTTQFILINNDSLSHDGYWFAIGH